MNNNKNMAVRALSLTTLAMVAFAGNSLLCRLALKETDIDAGNFTSIRLLTGALVLWILVQLRQGLPSGQGSLPSALALFVYAAAFSYAYITLDAGIGALPLLKASSAATIQLSVPVIAAAGGVLLLGEALTLRLVFASLAILGGIALVILRKR